MKNNELIEKQREDLVKGALLHDIGKFIQRAEGKRNGKHQDFGYAYLKENVSEEVAEIALKHHVIKYNNQEDKTKYDYTKSDNLLHWIVGESDNLSSAERKELKGQNDEKIFWNPKIPLQSIFCNIMDYTEKNYFYNLNNDQNITYPEKNIELTQGLYKSNVEKFKNDFNLIKNNIDTDRILIILEKYLSNVPSYTAERDEDGIYPDLSLFDHSKTTAAIANVIYNYLIEEDIIPQKYNKLKRIINSNNCFGLIRFDISGIQNFIYTIASKGALKNLKARSLYLELIAEHISCELVERLDLGRANILYNGGGGGLILVQNTKNTQQKIQKIFDDLNKWLWKIFENKLFIAYAYEDFDSEPLKLKTSLEKTFPKIVVSLTEKLSDVKHRKFIDCIDKEMFYSNKIHSGECEICKFPLYKKNEGKCDICKRLEKIGQTFNKDIKYLVKYSEIQNDNYIEINNKYYYFVKDITNDEYDNIYVVNSLDINLYKNDFSTVFYAGQFYKTEDKFKELTEFSDMAYGNKKLGILRMDIDNLGSIFKKGFKEKEQSISRFSVLSRNLNNFFKYHIHEIIDDNKNELFTFKNRTKEKYNNVSVVYSGGDDLFILGAWDDILEKSFKIRQCFKTFVANNPNINLSSGYVIVNPKFPTHVFAELSEIQEKSAKNHIKDKKSKDSISLWDTPIFWNEFIDEFNDLMKSLMNFEFNTSKHYLEIKNLEHTFFYSLISEIDKAILNFDKKDKKDDFMFLLPKLAYKLGRYYQRNKSKFRDNKSLQNSFENLKNKLCDLTLTRKYDNIEDLKEYYQKLTVYLKIFEFMQRNKK